MNRLERKCLNDDSGLNDKDLFTKGEWGYSLSHEISEVHSTHHKHRKKFKVSIKSPRNLAGDESSNSRLGGEKKVPFEISVQLNSVSSTARDGGSGVERGGSSTAEQR